MTMLAPMNTPASSDGRSNRLVTRLAEAARYWEPRRLGYNAVLLAVLVGWIVLSWPHFREALTPRSLLPMGVLALLANACYCAAYPLDLLLQASRLATSWRNRRWLLWTAGTVFAALLACYWIGDEIYPGVSAPH